MRGNPIFLACLCAALLCPVADGAVMVLSNRTSTEISFRLSTLAGAVPPTRDVAIGPSQTMPIPLDGKGRLSFPGAGGQKTYDVAPNGIYYFGESKPGAIDLGQIALGSGGSSPANAPRPANSAEAPPAPVSQILTIPVKILCDQDEISPRATWEKRMRARFDKVSKIFRQHCFTEFEIVAVDSWQADNSLVRLEDSLAEFERLVDPAPARLAIGFSGQHRANFRYDHLGGTRGPLNSHLLMREWVNANSESERLEVLVHELGHFLGAVHSPEPTSVMRAILGDRRARRTKFQIGFDPLNTLAMCLIRDELTLRPDVRIPWMRPTTRVELRKIYAEMARVLPDDLTITQWLRALDAAARQPPALGAR